MILRFSQKLGSRLKTGTLKPLPMDDAPVADWTTHLSPFDLGFRLNDLLLSAIATPNRPHYGKPREAFRALIAESKAP